MSEVDFSSALKKIIVEEINKILLSKDTDYESLTRKEKVEITSDLKKVGLSDVDIKDILNELSDLGGE